MDTAPSLSQLCMYGKKATQIHTSGVKTPLPDRYPGYLSLHSYCNSTLHARIHAFDLWCRLRTTSVLTTRSQSAARKHIATLPLPRTAITFPSSTHSRRGWLRTLRGAPRKPVFFSSRMRRLAREAADCGPLSSHGPDANRGGLSGRTARAEY